MLRDRHAGFYVKERFRRQYIILPQSVFESWGEVRDIQQAVTSALGLVKATASEVGGLESEKHDLEGLIEELKLDLADFHILLAIDNLETISWESLRPLLSESCFRPMCVRTGHMSWGDRVALCDSPACRAQDALAFAIPAVYSFCGSTLTL